MACKVEFPMFSEDMIKSFGDIASLFEDAAARQQLGQNKTSGQEASGQKTPENFLGDLMKQFLTPVAPNMPDDSVIKSKDKFNLAIDVTGYQPEELKVKVADGFITVSGNRESASSDGNESESYQFSRRVKLPENVDIDLISSSMSLDKKTLNISAPLVIARTQEQVVPVEVKKTDNTMALD
ncbi:Alpha-crystallin B chain [Halotydeus destructor]|nr:Alpha-crystallin B chain [Halotydeus destructor]